MFHYNYYTFFFYLVTASTQNCFLIIVIFLITISSFTFFSRSHQLEASSFVQPSWSTKMSRMQQKLVKKIVHDKDFTRLKILFDGGGRGSRF